ncbi:MAG TPA: N-acetylmuramic acid 6-phosphate etherase [Ktedonobacterales bacterium]
MPDDLATGRRFSALATEQGNPATVAIDRMSPLEIVRAINADDAQVAAAVQRELPSIARALEAITARLRDGGRLIYVGAGTSGRIGALDAYECPTTFNTPPGMVASCLAGGGEPGADLLEDSAPAGEADLVALRVGARDAVVGIAASGRTPYVLGALTYARAQGALTVALVCSPDSPAASLAEMCIAPLVGPEVISGSTRLKAGTAQKMVLNMLSTGAMVLLGKTYGNLMVDVSATNEKLRARARGIVRQATALDDDAAGRLLAAAGGEAKTAIVMARLGLSQEAARARLRAHGGVLRAALDAAP